jgi:hypothetical protein
MSWNLFFAISKIRVVAIARSAKLATTTDNLICLAVSICKALLLVIYVEEGVKGIEDENEKQDKEDKDDDEKILPCVKCLIK